MSMDRCVKCDAIIDTDIDLDCYIPNPNHPKQWDMCVCEWCREREEARHEGALDDIRRERMLTDPENDDEMRMQTEKS